MVARSARVDKMQICFVPERNIANRERESPLPLHLTCSFFVKRVGQLTRKDVEVEVEVEVDETNGYAS